MNFIKTYCLPVLLLILLSCNSGTDTNKATLPETKERVPVSKDLPNPYIDTDASSMDMSYYPVDYPTLKMNHLISSAPLARVIYSRPHKAGRVIFGGLVPYNKQWRLGANEASEIEFFKTATIQNKKINPGRYIIYCMPEENKWNIILNNDIFTWGKEIDSTKDIMKFEIPVSKSSTICEFFTMAFQDEKDGSSVLLMAWDDVVAKLPISF